MALASVGCSVTVGEEELRAALEADGSGLAIELEAGDCFESPEGLATQTGVEQVLSVPLVPCDGPHGAEVFAVIEHSASASAPFPGELALGVESLGLCGEKLTGFIGGPPGQPPYDILVVTPTPVNWDDGHRRIVCSVYRLDGEAMVGSARGTGGCVPETGSGSTILTEDFVDGATVGDATATNGGASSIRFGSRGSGVAYACRLFPLEGTVEVAAVVEEAPGTILDSRGDRARLQGDIFLRVDHLGRVRFTLAPVGGVNPSDQVLASSRTSLTDGRCHTVAISYGSEGVELYVDGELQDSHPHTGSRYPDMVALGDWPADSVQFGFVGEVVALRTTTEQSDVALESCPE